MRLKKEWKFVLAFILEVLTITLSIKYVNNVTDEMNILCTSFLLFAINFILFVNTGGTSK